ERTGERHNDVAGPRPARRQRCDRFVFYAEISIRHVCGDLLVTRRYQCDAVARLIERIKHPHIAVSADAEDIRDIAGNEIFGNQLRALHSRHCRSLPAIAGLAPRHLTGAATLSARETMLPPPVSQDLKAVPTL